jgi:hypothetical protein
LDSTAAVSLEEIGAPIGEPISLTECALRLRAELGDAAPALVTLKRWSAAGHLDTAKHLARHASRARYQFPIVLQIAKSKRDTRQEPPAATSADAGEGRELGRGVDPDALVSLEAMIDRSVRAAVDAARPPSTQEAIDGAVSRALDQVLAKMAAPLANLEAARRMLMSKYDAEANLLRQRIEELQLENQRLKLRASDVDAGKMNSLLQRILDRLNSA